MILKRVESRDDVEVHHEYDMDYTVPVNYGSDHNGMDMDMPEHSPSNNETDYQLAEGMDIDHEDEREIEFSPKITLRKSLGKPQAVVADQKEKATKKAPKAKKPVVAHKRPISGSARSTRNDELNGLRHSSRRRKEPLEYWRGETYKYGRSDDMSNQALFPFHLLCNRRYSCGD